MIRLKKLGLILMEDFIRATMLWAFINYAWVYITPRLPALTWFECVAATEHTN